MRHDRTASDSSPPDQVQVSVLVPVLNEVRHIRDVADAMREQRLAGGVEFLFVDGGSDDGTRAVLEELARDDPRFRVFDNPARRTPQALNLALRNARGRVIARMDAHALYPPDYLARGVERLARGDVEWVSGPALARGNGRLSRRVALALGTRLGTGGADFRHAWESEIEVDTGFAGLWRRETLEAHGGWDEGWPNDQDYELAARIRKAGGRIVCLPQMAAWYFPRDSLPALARQYHRYGVYRVKTSRRHPESMRRSHVLPPALVAALLAAAVGPRALRPPARLGVAAYGAAVVAVSAGQAREHGRDAAALPAVFATMHLAWGLGFWDGCRRFGPPLAAVGRLAGRGRG